jgi:hypothetical protein
VASLTHGGIVLLPVVVVVGGAWHRGKRGGEGTAKAPPRHRHGLTSKNWFLVKRSVQQLLPTAPSPMTTMRKGSALMLRVPVQKPRGAKGTKHRPQFPPFPLCKR